MQWQIQDLQEKGRTPLQRLSGLFRRKEETGGNTPLRWSIFVYHLPVGSETNELVGLIEVTETAQPKRRVLLYHPVNNGVALNGRVITRTAETPVTLYPTSITQIDTQLAPVFMIAAEHGAGHAETEGSDRVVDLKTDSGDDRSQVVGKARSRRHGL